MPALTSARALQWSAPALAAALLGFTLWHHLGRAPPLSTAPPALHEIAGWSLFGQPAGDDSAPGAAPAPAVAPLDDLPPTALGLTVSGIAYSPDAASAHAIIGTPDGRQQQYTPGETLLDGVTVHAIRPLEVVISNQGTLESIPLPLESTGTGGASPPAPFSSPVLPQIPTSPYGAEPPPVPAAGPPGT